MLRANRETLLEEGSDHMTKEQYLRARIADIEQILNQKHLPTKYRRSQQHALLVYQMDLERTQSQQINSLL